MGWRASFAENRTLLNAEDLAAVSIRDPRILRFCGDFVEAGVGPSRQTQSCFQTDLVLGCLIRDIPSGGIIRI